MMTIMPLVASMQTEVNRMLTVVNDDDDDNSADDMYIAIGLAQVSLLGILIIKIRCDDR